MLHSIRLANKLCVFSWDCESPTLHRGRGTVLVVLLPGSLKNNNTE